MQWFRCPLVILDLNFDFNKLIVEKPLPHLGKVIRSSLTLESFFSQCIFFLIYEYLKICVWYSLIYLHPTICLWRGEYWEQCYRAVSLFKMRVGCEFECVANKSLSFPSWHWTSPEMQGEPHPNVTPHVAHELLVGHPCSKFTFSAFSSDLTGADTNLSEFGTF